MLRQEIIDKVDIHDANRVAFHLGDGKAGRLVAKVLKFRTIYGGSEYSFAKDPDFLPACSHPSEKYRVKFWKGILVAYFDKYKGLKAWHDSQIKFVKANGFLEIPSGRHYQFQPVFKYNDWKWPETTIKNYPVNLSSGL